MSEQYIGVAELDTLRKLAQAKADREKLPQYILTPAILTPGIPEKDREPIITRFCGAGDRVIEKIVPTEDAYGRR